MTSSPTQATSLPSTVSPALAVVTTPLCVDGVPSVATVVLIDIIFSRREGLVQVTGPIQVQGILGFVERTERALEIITDIPQGLRNGPMLRLA